MASLNKVMLIGNVGIDPEVRYLGGDGTSSKVASIRLATTERYRSRSGEMTEKTEWHNVTVWRGLADVVEKYVKKGSQLYIEGRLTTRQWTDKSGNTRYSTEVQADNLFLLGRKSDNQGENQGYGSPYQSYYTPKQASPQQQTPIPQQPHYQQSEGYQQQYAPSPQQPAQQPSPFGESGEEVNDDLPF